MSLRTVFLFLLCALAAVFLALNWQGVMAPASVNLMVTQIEAPLGLVLVLVFLALFCTVLFWSFFQQASVMAELRRLSRAAGEDRQLAEDAEKSRFEELRKVLTGEMARLDAEEKQRTAQFEEKLQSTEKAQTERLEALSAQLARLETALARVSAVPADVAAPEPAGETEKPELVALESAPQEEAPKKGFLSGLFHSKKPADGKDF